MRPLPRGGAYRRVAREPQMPALLRRRRKLALYLFLATCLSTFLVASLPYYKSGFRVAVIEGLSYSIAVMSILVAHEMGHYLQALRYRVPASLPYFIPMPLTPLGTMGAVILQGRGVADRRQMFDIAITGPLAGLIVAIPVTYYGLWSSTVVPLPEGGQFIVFGDPLIIEWMTESIHGEIPDGYGLTPNAFAFAGWVGILVTALNLIPIGQLDGGHILYTLIGKRAHAVAMLVMIGAVAWMLYTQNMAYSLLLILLMLMGTRHPPTADDSVPLGKLRIVLGWLTLAFIIIAADCLKRGTEALAREQYDYAVEMFTQSTKLVPDNVLFRQSLRGATKRMYKNNGSGAKMAGMKLMKIRTRLKKAQLSKDWVNVDSIAEEGLKVNPWDVNLNAAVGEACVHQGFSIVAIFAYECALEGEPNNKELNRTYALLQEERGNFAQAIAAWRRIAKVDPLDSQARSKCTQLEASTMMRDGNYDDAKSTQDVRTGYDYDRPGNKGRKTSGDQQADGPGMSVEADLERAIRKEPENKDHYLKFADYLKRENRLDEAAENLTKALELTGGSDHAIREQLEDVEIDQLRHNQSLALEAAKADPADVAAKKNSVALAKELLQREIEVLASRVERYPKDSRLKFQLAKNYKRCQQYAKAIPLLQQASSDNRIECEVLVMLGECFYEEKKLQLALRQFVKASEIVKPHDQTDLFKKIHYALGRLYEAAKKTAEAEEHYNEVLGFVAVFSVTVYGLLIVTQDVVDVFSVLRLMAILTAVLLIWNFDPSTVAAEPDDDAPEDESEDMTSLVALMPESRYLDAAIVSRLASDAWGVEVSVDDDDELFAVTGESPHFLIRAEDRFFVVHNVDQPYFEDPEDFASRVLESRICRAVMEHEAWISVDVLDVEGCGESDPECYRMIAKLLAELIDDSCLAICCPEVGSIHPYQSNFSDKLRSDDPLTALRDDALPPVIHVDEDDPRMLAAVEAARRTWPDFIGAFENRSADQTFSVKAPLRDSTGCEQIWLTVTAVENDVIYGIVGNEPVRLKRYKIDDRARVPLSELSDWMYFDDGELRGGYTIEVLSRVAAERARRRPGN
eukprot:g21979.t1